MRLVVGQNSIPRRLTLTVRAPWRMPPSGFIRRHWGLHRGMLPRSDTSSHTRETGALMSICACNSGAAMSFSFR